MGQWESHEVLQSEMPMLLENPGTGTVPSEDQENSYRLGALLRWGKAEQAGTVQTGDGCDLIHVHKCLMERRQETDSPPWYIVKGQQAQGETQEVLSEKHFFFFFFLTVMMG